MRFYEDLDYYYFSENPISDDEERSIIYEQSIGYLKDQMGRAFRPEASAGANAKKYFPIALFAIAVILLIFFSINKMVGALIFTFGGIFIAFGIMALLPGNKDQQVELPQQAKIPRGVGAAMAIMIGLAVIIPAIIAPKFGYTKSFLIAGGAWFTLAGLFFIVYTIIGMARFSRAQKNSVQGKCIGYIKMLEGSGSNNSYHQRRIVTGTPVFEYTIRGITYKAFQEDNMRTGRLTPNVGDTVDLGVLPEDPYAVFYHKNTNARVIAFVLSIMALAAGIFLFCMVPKFDDSNGFRVNTMGGDVQIAKAQFNDKGN